MKRLIKYCFYLVSLLQAIKMPYKYERKCAKRYWDAHAMRMAIDAVGKDKKPFFYCSKAVYCSKENTLKRRVLDKNKGAVEDKNILGKYRSVFRVEQELELCDNIFNMDKMFYGIIIQG